MKNEKNLINTKDKLIESFTPEQKEIFEFYKSKFISNEDLLPMIAEDKELANMEKAYEIMQKVFKAEVVIALAVATIAVVLNLSSKSGNFQTKYTPVASYQIEFNYQLKE